MKLTKYGKITVAQADWSVGDDVIAAVTTRNGGVSRPPYNSLNLGDNTDDAPYNVEGNRSTFLREFDVPLHHLLLVKQVHGCDVVVVDSANYDVSHFREVEADAVITNQSGLMLGMLVADCYPVLLFDVGRRVIAAVHVGWRGCAAGLVGKVVVSMRQEFGCCGGDIRAFVGPGIGAAHYQVGRDVRDAFRSGVGNWEQVAEEVDIDQWRLDLCRSIQLQLEQAGVSAGNCDVSGLCTWEHRELFFSHRRDAGQTGRQMGFVMLRS